jgi:hypothetical protein
MVGCYGDARRASGGVPLGVGLESTRENSAVSLKYQINAAPPTTSVKTSRVNSMPTNDFMRAGYRHFAITSSGKIFGIMSGSTTRLEDLPGLP